MRVARIRNCLYVLLLCIGAGCANIVPPAGGKKDTTPPGLVSVVPADSQLNTRVTRIVMRFNEFINVNNAAAEVQVSPLLRLPLNVVAAGRTVTVKIPDSLLQDNTTYRVSFGNAIGDLHENNVFANYTYTFSTGSYFDSLQLGGWVYNAATGLPDTGVFVMLYDAAGSDSAIVREKPLYVARAAQGGGFLFRGLPYREFRIYALRDANNNLIYDGGDEFIAFSDTTVFPVESVASPLKLRTFKEKLPDTALADSTSVVGRRGLAKSRDVAKEGFFYTVAVDTSDARKRTFDVTKPLSIIFNKAVDSLNKERISLAWDSADITVEAPFTVDLDTAREERVQLKAAWKEDAVYTLRLLKGFAKDTALADAMPSRHVFRTKSDDDYGKLNIHLPSKYKSRQYLLMVNNETDTVYLQPVLDTMVHLVKLRPAAYTLRVISDKNENGQWDTGDLFGRLQPEEVIPYSTVINLKAGWENTIDFEVTEKGRPGADSPQKRDKPR